MKRGVGEAKKKKKCPVDFKRPEVQPVLHEADEYNTENKHLCKAVGSKSHFEERLSIPDLAPLRCRDDFHLVSPLHPTGVTPVGIASTAVTLLHHARRLLTRTAWNLSYFPVSIFTG